MMSTRTQAAIAAGLPAYAVPSAAAHFGEPDPTPKPPSPQVERALSMGMPEYAAPSAEAFFAGESSPAPDPPPRPAPPPPPPGGPPPGGPPPGGSPSPPPPSSPSWTELMEQQRKAAEAARQRLEGEYASRRDELRAEYQFAETEEEKAQLAFLMAELDKATERADQAIVAGYAHAVQSIQGLQVSGQASTAQEAQAVQNIFLAAGSQYADMAGDVQRRIGLQAGLAGDAYAPTDDFYSLLAADQAREATMAQRMGGVVASEMTDAERRMAFQQASQLADLQRQSAASGAQTRADQQAAVAARIAADRRDFTNQLSNLQTTYATLGAGFDQTGIESYGEQAAMAAEEAMMREQLAAQERMANASIAASLREMEAQWAREDAARPDWQTEELAQALLEWDLLPEHMKTEENYDRILGPHFDKGTSDLVELPRVVPRIVAPGEYGVPVPTPSPPSPRENPWWHRMPSADEAD